jgi:hypothetical protein
LLWIVLTAVAAVAAVFLAFFLIGAAVLRQAPQRFRENRDQLQADFLAAARTGGKPRGLVWKALDWTVGGVVPEATLARDRRTGETLALVPVTIQFEAVVGSDMEGLPAVGNLRNASAVFFYRAGRWHTTGRAVFNLNPDEAVAHFKDQFDPLNSPAPPATGTR